MTETASNLFPESGRESRRERFLRLAPRRVDKALIAIRRIGNLAAPTYESTEAERQKIIDAAIASNLTPANDAMTRFLGEMEQRYGSIPGSLQAGHTAALK